MPIFDYLIQGVTLFGLLALIFLILALTFSLLETCYPLNKQKHFRTHLKIDLGLGLVNAFIIYYPLKLAIVPALLFAQLIIPSSFKLWVSTQPSWLQFIEITLIADISIYTSHRLLHTVPFLWRFHSIHHSAKELDWATGFRNHTIDVLIMRGWMTLLLVMLSFDPHVLSLYFVYFALQTTFIHSNTRFHFGPFRFIYVSPCYHRWHHSDDPRARDKNFVAHFPWIDALFGTLYLPKNFPETLGIDEPVTEGIFAHLTSPFRRRIDS